MSKLIKILSLLLILLLATPLYAQKTFDKPTRPPKKEVKKTPAKKPKAPVVSEQKKEEVESEEEKKVETEKEEIVPEQEVSEQPIVEEVVPEVTEEPQPLPAKEVAPKPKFDPLKNIRIGYETPQAVRRSSQNESRKPQGVRKRGEYISQREDNDAWRSEEVAGIPIVEDTVAPLVEDVPSENVAQTKQESTSGSSQYGMINGHEWVDLGLSVKWATCNIGANRPEEHGDYYAWGEIEPKKKYTENNSIALGMEFTDISGDAKYDAARANWGSSWRMPTKKEQDELLAYCKMKWVVQNDVRGILFTSKKNGKSIFLPASGFRFGEFRYDVGDRVDYWSSTPDTEEYEYSYTLWFHRFQKEALWNFRNYGHSIRAVTD